MPREHTAIVPGAQPLDGDDMHLPAATHKAAIGAALTGLLLGSGAAAIPAAMPTVKSGSAGHGATPGRPGDTPAAGFHPGAPGLGDPYFPLEGNGGYDVAHYDLELAYSPSTHVLQGSNTIRATATQNLSSFDLDLSGYRVSGVEVDGQAATFTRKGQELTITPAAKLPRGQAFTTKVSYAGKPKTVVGSPIVFGAPYGWIYTHDGAFVGCEPNAAHTWFPSNDHPSDKASFTFHITVPKSKQVVANGSLVSQQVHRNKATFGWDEKRPMATYLATIDIGRWRFHSTTSPGGLPEFVAIDPALAAEAQREHAVAMTGTITDYWQHTFGRYAFGSTGAIIDNVPDIGFSLETQTRPLYGFVPGPDTASHELAHEWFGDSVSVTSWKNIWLNEGFATFASWLWNEHTSGVSTWQTARRYYSVYGPGAAFWKLAVADPGRNRMFHTPVYIRGAMTLAALRHKIGQPAFARLLRNWARDHRYGNATTHDFVTLANQVSGRDLTHFFRVWLWKQTKPPLS